MYLNKSIIILLIIVIISLFGIYYKDSSNSQNLTKELIALSPQSSSAECGCLITLGYGDESSNFIYTKSIIDTINSNSNFQSIFGKAEINLDNCDSSTCSIGECAVEFTLPKKPAVILEGKCSLYSPDPNPSPTELSEEI